MDGPVATCFFLTVLITERPSGSRARQALRCAFGDYPVQFLFGCTEVLCCPDGAQLMGPSFPGTEH